jgi:dipeptidyl aminopeptidase/acylaminoacyl peptidase
VFRPGKTGVLVAQEKASEAPNYIFVRGKTVTSVTDIHPEKGYNWLRSELLKYKDKDGQECEGMLFKPSNFDSTKKYPVIFHYYWDNSRQINNFILPDPKGDGINIPLLVNDGYLVFWPNIYIKKRSPGESAMNSVLAAADCISRYSWVDSSKMALAGHSWGGYITNYIIAHTNRFKAATSFSGVSDLMQMYNQLWPGYGYSYQAFAKNFYGMVDGLQQNVPNYVTNSPIAYADHIQTPLLLMHNVKDDAVPFEHSTALFVQLRSLVKPVWLLQYEGEEHFLSEVGNQLDLQKRIQGFFAHYLKNEPMPRWMEKPISPE